MMKALHTVLPASDLGRARSFYHDKLGLDPDETREGSLVFHPAPGAEFEIYETPNAGTAQNTQMVWMTDDLDGEMAVMRSNGIVFEDYDMPGMTTRDGVMEGTDLRCAWFRDSEGNYLCVAQTR